MNDIVQRRRKKSFSLVLPSSVFFDANTLDQLQRLNNDQQSLLLHLAEEHRLCIILPKGVVAELDHPNTPSFVKNLAPDIYTIEVPLTFEEELRRTEIIRVFKGNAKFGKHDPDADHIFEAEKYQARFFVTSDTRIKNKAANVCPQLQVLALNEFMQLLSKIHLQA